MTVTRIEPTLIVLESSGIWAARLRHCGLPPRLVLREVRSIEQCTEQLINCPRALVGIAVTAENLAAMLDLQLRLASDHPEASVIVLADRGLERYELLFREGGAAHVVFSPRQLSSMIELLARYTLCIAAGPLTPERIWAELPWA